MLALLLSSVLLPFFAQCEFVVQDQPAGLAPALIEETKETADGFLEENAAPFIFTDEKAGRWVYIDHTLRVEINRSSADVRGRPTVWYIAHIFFRGGTVFRSYLSNPEHPGRNRERPEIIAARNNVIYAQNGDLFTYRVQEKRYPGIIIRDRKIVHSQTYTKRVTGVAPLDELSLYPDGRMEVRYPGEISAQEYLSLGATDVFAFGPILIQDGVKDERLKNAWNSNEPRSAIGLVAPGHAVGILVEGRNKRSDGVPLRFVADRLLQQGCITAYNLDGGQTAAMMFLGKNVMDPGTYNGYHKTRSQPDIIGIGKVSKPTAPTK